MSLTFGVNPKSDPAGITVFKIFTFLIFLQGRATRTTTVQGTRGQRWTSWTGGQWGEPAVRTRTWWTQKIWWSEKILQIFVDIWPWGSRWKGKVDNPWMIWVRNNKRLSLPSSMPKIYAKLKLIMLKDSVNSEYFLEEFMVPAWLSVPGLSGLI